MLLCDLIERLLDAFWRCQLFHFLAYCFEIRLSLAEQLFGSFTGGKNILKFSSVLVLAQSPIARFLRQFLLKKRIKVFQSRQSARRSTVIVCLLRFRNPALQVMFN